jgi:hypothetical protein
LPRTEIFGGQLDADSPRARNLTSGNHEPFRQTLGEQIAGLTFDGAERKSNCFDGQCNRTTLVDEGIFPYQKTMENAGTTPSV